MTRALKLSLTALTGAAVLAAAALWWLNRPAAIPTPPITLTLAIPQRPATASGFIAADAGNCARQGLTVSLQDAASGVAAVQMVTAGKVDWLPQHHAVRLHPELLGMLEAQQQWTLRRGLVAGGREVKVRELLWHPGLAAVAPASITIRR